MSIRKAEKFTFENLTSEPVEEWHSRAGRKQTIIPPGILSGVERSLMTGLPESLTVPDDMVEQTIRYLIHARKRLNARLEKQTETLSNGLVRIVFRARHLS